MDKNKLNTRKELFNEYIVKMRNTTQSEETINERTFVGSCFCNVLSIVFITKQT